MKSNRPKKITSRKQAPKQAFTEEHERVLLGVTRSETQKRIVADIIKVLRNPNIKRSEKIAFIKKESERLKGMGKAIRQVAFSLLGGTRASRSQSELAKSGNFTNRFALTEALGLSSDRKAIEKLSLRIHDIKPDIRLRAVDSFVRYAELNPKKVSEVGSYLAGLIADGYFEHEPTTKAAIIRALKKLQQLAKGIHK